MFALETGYNSHTTDFASHLIYLHISECTLYMQTGSEHLELGKCDKNAVVYAIEGSRINIYVFFSSTFLQVWSQISHFLLCMCDFLESKDDMKII